MYKFRFFNVKLAIKQLTKGVYKIFLAPTGAQGVKMSVRPSVRPCVCAAHYAQ